MNDREMSEAGRKIRNAMQTPLPLAWARGIVGAAFGAVAGWFIHFWLKEQGFYALALPGALVGLGFGFLANRRMVAGGIFCAVVALVLTIVMEWTDAPFKKDDSLVYFVTHLLEVDSKVTLIFIGLAGMFAYWFGRGR
ncbi:MAG: hypothetical protein AAF456_24175 [Planctomycetota bacterium]